MSTSQMHLEDATLQAWMAGDLADDENESLERHLEGCDQCARQLDQLEPVEDALVRHLRDIFRASLVSSRASDTDVNLLFGTLALQANLINSQQFSDACVLWASQPAATLADVLVQQDWISAADRQRVQQLLEQRQSTVGSSSNMTRETLLSAGSDTVNLSPPMTQRIELESIYSTGGIGQIWRAHDNVLGRQLALKELLPEKTGSPANRERFFREARITAQLTHPGTPPVYEYVEQEGRCWYTMKFIHGQSLTEVIHEYHEKKNNSDALAQLMQLLNHFVSICNTVAYAHAKKILHRDLKSDNVIVGKFGEVIVLDWGLAKKLAQPSASEEASASQSVILPSQSTDPRATLQGERLGTPAFMAPEQAQGLIDKIDYRTDVYGLAAILYEMLTGKAPFEGNDIWQVMDRVENERPKSPHELASDVPPELAAICMRGLEKQQTQRQQSASEIGGDVQNWIVEQAHRKQTDQQRQLFFDLSMDLLVIHDQEFRLQLTNPAWETILGWTREDLEKMTIWDILHPDDHEPVRRQRELIITGNPLSKLEHRCLCKDGSYKWIRWGTAFIEDENVGYSVGHDISDLRHVQCRCAALLEAAPDAIVVIDAKGNIDLLNRETENLFGYTRSELLGQPIEKLVPERFRADHPALVQSYLATGVKRPLGIGKELFGRHRDGHDISVEISLSPIESVKGAFVICTIRPTRTRNA